MSLKILPGQSYPLGSTVYAVGVNFCIYSKHATGIDLLLFDNDNWANPSRIITLDSKWNRTFFYWHVFVPGLKAGQLYAFRAHGPFDPSQGWRFDPTKVLLDPYSRAIIGDEIYNREDAIKMGDNSKTSLKSVVVDTRGYDWEGDRPLRIPYSTSVIYDLWIKEFTHNPNSGLPESECGTFTGIIEKIPYFVDLGITAIRMGRVQQFDEQDFHDHSHDITSEFRTLAFFAPHRGYCSCKDPLGPVNEFRDMVKALHRADIEILIDITPNTAEGDENGPTLSFKGMDNQSYYILEEEQRFYKAPEGWGNALKMNNAVVNRFFLDCLRYWVANMHVDGFFINFDPLEAI